MQVSTNKINNNKYFVALELLNHLALKNCEAVIVGGFVRDYLLGKESQDIDIATNASFEVIFGICQVKFANEKIGYFQVEYNGCYFEISKYRREIRMNLDMPIVEFVNNLQEDLMRRDFTINTLAINSNGQIIDCFDSEAAINSRSIVCVGKPKRRFHEDNSRILRALRFSVCLDFSLDMEIVQAIKSFDVLEISDFIYQTEMTKIIRANKLNEFLNLLDKLDINYLFPFFSNFQRIQNIRLVNSYDDLMKVKACLNNEYDPLTKFQIMEQMFDANNIDQLIHEITLTQNLLRDEVERIYQQMPLHNSQELDYKFTNEDYKRFGKTLKQLKSQLIAAILCGTLANEQLEITQYLEETFFELTKLNRK